MRGDDDKDRQLNEEQPTDEEQSCFHFAGSTATDGFHISHHPNNQPAAALCV